MLHSCLVCLVLLTVAVGNDACTFRDIDRDTATLNLYVYLDQQMATKATVGDIAAISDDEKRVNTLQIWVFKNATGEQIGYIAPSSNSLMSGNEEKYSTMIKKTFADEAKSGGGLAVDVFVLANAASVGLSFNETTDRATLRNALITGFGTSTLTTADSIKTNGLPMSCVATKTMTGTDLQFEIEKVKLTRAVSKVRFVFCQSGEEVGGVMQASETFTLNSISLGVDYGRIPETEYVFNDSANDWKVGSSYVSPFSIPLPATIPLVLNPRSYTYTNQGAQDYENLINQAVRAGTLSQMGPYYLRESNEALKGTVSYTVAGETKTTSFQMAAPGDFSRNHSWTVYVYFSDAKLFIHPVVADWTLASEMHYTTKIDTRLQAVEVYRRYDTDGDYSTWQNSYMLVSAGYMDSDGNAVVTPGIHDRPTYSRRILLYTEAPGTDMQLNIDNPNFKLVLYDGETQTYDHSLSGGQSLLITGGTYSGPETDGETREGVALTYFYVVPVTTMPSTATLEQRTCHVYLTTVSSAIGSVKIPFNSESLPGYSGASDEIWFYYMGADVYNSTGILVDPYSH